LRTSIKLLFSLAALPALVGAAGIVSWQEVGGFLSTSATFKGIAGQGYETPPTASAGARIQSGFLAHPLLLNNAPFVVSGLPDLEKSEGFGKVAILLDAVFADIDGDSLSYSSSDSGTSAVASVHGDSLLLSGMAGISGTSRIIVLATDGSDTARDTFRVATATDALVAKPEAIEKSTELSVVIPNALASPVRGTGPGRLGIGAVSDGSEGLSTDILLPGTASVSVSIFDNLGNPVISFTKDVGAAVLWGLERTPDGRWILPVGWNLRSSGGTAVPSGVYLWKIEAVCEDGQKLEAVKRLGVKGRN